MDSFTAFLDSLHQQPILEPKQLEELDRRLTHLTDLQSLTADLFQRGWLTAHQIAQLARGKGASLILGGFVLLDILGEGGMGRVFKARQRSLNRLVALKVIRPGRLNTPAAQSRFRREVEVIARLDHLHIVHAYDADEVNGIYFLAMEYIDGTDLARLAKQGPLPTPLSCDYIRQAALGLQHAYERGMVHRDIKPTNLMLTRVGVIKILDLGLAHLASEVVGDAQTDLTGTGTVLGTAD
jgi:serine/threonine protein kinase